MGFVELHFHLLPGIDDGPRTLADSLQLATAAVAEGTDTVVATPHVHPEHVTDPRVLPDRVAELKAELRRERIPLRVLAGGELAHPMVAQLTDDQLQAIAHGPPGARWVLLEAAFAGLDAEFTAAADELRRRRLAVVLAHPERARPGSATDDAIAHELDRGSVLQINAWSVAGRYGEDVRRRAERLLRAAPGAALASDAHGRERAPALREGIAALTAAGDRNPARRAREIPRALLRGGLACAPARRAA